MPSRFYVYHHNTDDIEVFNNKEDFVYWLSSSADCECQSYATSKKDLNEILNTIKDS